MSLVCQQVLFDGPVANRVLGATHGNLGGHTVLGPDGLPVFDHTIKVFLQVYVS